MWTVFCCTTQMNLCKATKTRLDNNLINTNEKLLEFIHTALEIISAKSKPTQ